MKLAAYALIAALLPMPLFAKDTKEETFWKWFEKNQDDLYHFEKDTEAVFDPPISVAVAQVVGCAQSAKNFKKKNVVIIA